MAPLTPFLMRASLYQALQLQLRFRLTVMSLSPGSFRKPRFDSGFCNRSDRRRALRFQSVTQDAGGALRLRILNGTGKPWVLQGSSNLMLWSNLTTNLSSNNISTDSDSS